MSLTCASLNIFGPKSRIWAKWAWKWRCWKWRLSLTCRHARIYSGELKADENNFQSLTYIIIYNYLRLRLTVILSCTAQLRQRHCNLPFQPWIKQRSILKCRFRESVYLRQNTGKFSWCRIVNITKYPNLMRVNGVHFGLDGNNCDILSDFKVRDKGYQ